MRGKVEYFEKYSVSPCPSRDYYGIKVHHDEVILYLWKISHGPHLHPVVRIAKFSEFGEDKTIPEDIRRVFGENVLEHVKNIALQKENSLLTLPKNVITHIVKYLKARDIIKLFKLSTISKEVFSINKVWEILYKRKYGSKLSEADIDREMACGFQQLMKDRQAKEALKNRKTQDSKRVSSPKVSQPKVQRSVRPASASTMSEKFPFSISTTKEKKTKPPSAKPPKNDERSLDIKPVESRMNVLGSISSDKRSATSKVSKTNLHSRASTNLSHLMPSKPKMSDFAEPSSKSNFIRTQKKLLDETDIIFEKERPWSILNSERRGSGENIKRTKSKQSTSNSVVSTKPTKMTPTGDSPISKKEQIPKKGVKETKASKNEIKMKKGSPRKAPKTNQDLYQDYINMKESDPELKMLIKESMKRLKSPRTIFDYDFSTLGHHERVQPNSETKAHGGESDTSSLNSDVTLDDSASLKAPSMISYLKNKYLLAASDFEKVAASRDLPRSFGEKLKLSGRYPKPDDDSIQDFSLPSRMLTKKKDVKDIGVDLPTAYKGEANIKNRLTTGTSRFSERLG